MDLEEFRKRGHELVDWMTEFYRTIEERPVRSQVAPGEIMEQLPAQAPEDPESFDAIFKDFQEIVMPGITHWQHPSFFAFFPANSSYPSVLAEMLTATLGAQCMIWQTSPAAAEMEQRIMEWLRDMLGLPGQYEGVIQDTASTSTLVSILTAREQVTNYRANEAGLQEQPPLMVYASAQTHSSIEKAVKIAGLGAENYRMIPVDDTYAMDPNALEQAIQEDRDAGWVPCCVVATIGTTGSTAIDPLRPTGEICRRHGVWLHVDAALAGSALVLEEQRWIIDGIEYADTFVFNPHKWLLTNFDCSAYFVRDKSALLRTLEIHPEYLKTREGQTVNNYRDWGIQLGRRFRALKLWFVLRTYGVSGLRELIQKHIGLAQWIADQVRNEPDFELLAPVPLNTVCFRYTPNSDAAQHGENATDHGSKQQERLNTLNQRLLERLNDSGKLYMTHTKLDGRYTLRFVVGQTFTERRHVEAGWELVKTTARSLTE
jgi:aromatic-L-amino-acid decarboxylase